MKIKLNAKNIIIFICIIVVIILGMVCGIKEYKKSQLPKYKPVKISEEKNDDNKEKDKDSLLKNKEKDTEEYKREESIYSEEWKKYMELSKEEKENLDLVPRKYEIPIEKIEEIKIIEGIVEEDKNKEKNEDKNKEDNEDKDEEDNEDKDEEKNEEDNEDKDKNEEDNEEKDEEDKEIVIPEKFNLNDKINIKIENQGNYGLCWDFASMKSLETHLALTEGKEYDFSEMHLDYMESKLLYGDREIHDGGNFGIFEAYNLKGGEVLEKDVPYKEFGKSEYEKFPDMDIVMNVTETINFPSINKDGRFQYSDEQIADFRKCVKKHIMTYGGLTTGIYHSYEKCSYLPPSAEVWPDHLVTIVGWDDNYPKENFKGTQPNNDGAYLILNSWGPNANDNGYYYISYEDKYVETAISGVISTKFDSAYKISDLKESDIKKYIIDILGHLIKTYNGEDYITQNALNQIHTLDLSNREISTIDGIELFKNARIIDLSNNNISDLSPIKKLKNNAVVSLNLSNNKIKDLSGIEEIYQLEELNISNNEIKSISNLKDMNKLNILNTSGCNIKDFSNYGRLNSVKHIIASNTQDIINIDKLPNNVESITLKNCGINNIDDLINNDNIINMYLEDNNIEEIPNNNKLARIKNIDVSNNPIKNWDWLSQLNGITLLKAQKCNIEDITILDKLYDSVLLVDFSYNKINDVSKLINFDRLIEEIDLSNNGRITGLEGINSIPSIVMKNCEIDGRELIKLTNVSELNLDNCKIDDLNSISNLTHLWKLSLENCNVTDVTFINKLFRLDILNLSNNKNLSGKISLSSLGELYLSNCNLKDNSIFSECRLISYLDISNNPNFTKIYDVVKNGEIIVRIDTISADDFEKLDTLFVLFGIENMVIEGNCTIDNNNHIDLRNNQSLKKYVMRNWCFPFEIDNGVIQKNKNLIKVIDKEQDNVFIKINSKIDTFSYIKGINIKFELNNNSLNDRNTYRTENNELNEQIEENTIENEETYQIEESNVNDEYGENAVSNSITKNVVNNIIIENSVESNVINEINNVI